MHGGCAPGLQAPADHLVEEVGEIIVQVFEPRSQLRRWRRVFDSLNEKGYEPCKGILQDKEKDEKLCIQEQKTDSGMRRGST